MAEFIFAYHGGKKPESAEAAAELMARWQGWIGGLGAAFVNPGAPLACPKPSVHQASWTMAGRTPYRGFPLFKPKAWMPPLKWQKGARTLKWAPSRSRNCWKCKENCDLTDRRVRAWTN